MLGVECKCDACNDYIFIDTGTYCEDCYKKLQQEIEELKGLLKAMDTGEEK